MSSLFPLPQFWEGEGVFPLCLKPSGDFPGGSDREESARNVGDLGLTPGSGRSHGEGNGYQLQYSCLQNSMDTGTWRAIVQELLKLYWCYKF